MAELKCAKCTGTLKVFISAGANVDRCDTCRGLFFNRGELSRLLSDANLESVTGEDAKSGTAVPHSGADSAAATCPACRIPMGRLEAGTGEGFAYDLCPACNALWLDAGELAFLERSNAPAQLLEKQQPDQRKRRGVAVLAEIEAQLEFIEKQKRDRLGRLDRMMKFGLSDTKEILSIQRAIETESDVARRMISGSQLFDEARKLVLSGTLEPKDFEVLRTRLGVRE